MIIKREEAIKRLKAGSLLCETIWGGYHYTIDGDTVLFQSARKFIKEGLVIEDKSKGKSPLVKWFKWKGGTSGQ